MCGPAGCIGQVPQAIAGLVRSGVQDQWPGGRHQSAAENAHVFRSYLRWAYLCFCGLGVTLAALHSGESSSDMPAALKDASPLREIIEKMDVAFRGLKTSLSDLSPAPRSPDGSPPSLLRQNARLSFSEYQTSPPSDESTWPPPQHSRLSSSIRPPLLQTSPPGPRHNTPGSASVSIKPPLLPTSPPGLQDKCSYAECSYA